MKNEDKLKDAKPSPLPTGEEPPAVQDLTPQEPAEAKEPPLTLERFREMAGGRHAVVIECIAEYDYFLQKKVGPGFMADVSLSFGFDKVRLGRWRLTEFKVVPTEAEMLNRSLKRERDEDNGTHEKFVKSK